MRDGMLVGAVCRLHVQAACADGYRTSGNFVGSPASFPVQATTYDTCQNLPYPPSRRAKEEEAMPRHPRHPRKSAFSGLLLLLVLSLWLGGTLSACGSVLRPGAADQGTPASPANTPGLLLGARTPPVRIAQATLH